jgi:hypothetical protein
LGRNGKPVTQPKAHHAQILPTRSSRESNFPNTDCVSCHSESTRRQAFRLSIDNDGFAYQRPPGISGSSSHLLPADGWNVRNFGWSPFNSPPETVTTRTANETAAAVDFINHEYFGQPIAKVQLPVKSGGAPVNLGTIPSGATIPQPKVAPTPLGTTVAPLPGNAPNSAAVSGSVPSKLPAIQAVIPPTPPVANALTLEMTIKSKGDFLALQQILAAEQAPSQNQINAAMTKLGIVHFARFVFLGEDKLLVITNYDGSFERYIAAFTDAIGPVFDALLSHMADAPPLPVESHQDEFLKYIQDRDLSSGQPGYSAYPQLKVQDILTLQKNAEK